MRLGGDCYELITDALTGPYDKLPIGGDSITDDSARDIWISAAKPSMISPAMRHRRNR